MSPNGDFLNTGNDFSDMGTGELKFNPKDFLIRSDCLDYIKNVFLA